MKALSYISFTRTLFYVFLFIVITYFFAICANAQVPMKYNYQAVARSASGTTLVNQTISIRIALLNGGAAGNAVYMEHHSVTTNAFGVFSLQVGAGTIDMGTMNAVPWTTGNIWMKVEMDANGGANYIVMGTTQLLSVPYAMIAGQALNGGSGGNNLPVSLDTLTDVGITNAVVGQVLKFDGTKWSNGVDNAGSGGSSLWNASGNNIYNMNSGSVGIGTSSPTAMLHIKNITASNTGNNLSIENNGLGYNLYSYKTGSSEAVYLVKDNMSSGTPNIYATNNGSGNTMDVFATGSGYAGSFRGGPASAGSLYATVTSGGYAGIFDGDVSGNGVYGKVSGNGLAGNFDGKVKINFHSNSISSAQLQINETNSGEYARINFSNGGSSYWGVAALASSTAVSAKMTFLCSATSDILTLTGDGNVGITNSSPAAKLHIVASGSYNYPLMKIENSSSSNINPVVSISNVASGELITASKTGVGYGINIQKTGIISSSAAIYGATAGGNGEGIRGSAFGAGGYGVYGNAAGNGASSFTGVYGYGSGGTGIDYGVYGQQGASTMDYAAYFNGNIGYTGTLSSTSDIRLKENIKDYSGGLNAVMQLKPSTYQYKHDGIYENMKLPVGNQYGLVAQDIENVLPELVTQTSFVSLHKEDGETKPTENKIDYKCVNYIGMIPVLVNAIQEQQKEIESLQKQLDDLKK